MPASVTLQQQVDIALALATGLLPASPGWKGLWTDQGIKGFTSLPKREKQAASGGTTIVRRRYDGYELSDSFGTLPTPSALGVLLAAMLGEPATTHTGTLSYTHIFTEGNLPCKVVFRDRFESADMFTVEKCALPSISLAGEANDDLWTTVNLRGVKQTLKVANATSTMPDEDDVPFVNNASGTASVLTFTPNYGTPPTFNLASKASSVKIDLSRNITIGKASIGGHPAKPNPKFGSFMLNSSLMYDFGYSSDDPEADLLAWYMGASSTTIPATQGEPLWGTVVMTFLGPIIETTVHFSLSFSFKAYLDIPDWKKLAVETTDLSATVSLDLKELTSITLINEDTAYTVPAS